MRLKSHRALHDYMKFKGLETAYALAKEADILHGTAGHLVSGRRSTCSVRTARAIEEALGCPPGFLFAAEMSKVHPDTVPVKSASRPASSSRTVSKPASKKGRAA